MTSAVMPMARTKESRSRMPLIFIVDEKGIKAAELLGRERRDESLGRSPSSPGASRQPGSLDRVDGRQDKLGGAQALDDPARYRFARVGRPCGRGREFEGEGHGGA